MSKISQCAICVAMRDTFWDIRPNFEIFRYILTITLSIWQFWVVQTLRTYFELSAHTPSIVRTYFELSRHFSQTGFHETMTQNLQGYLFRPYASAPLPLPISESGGNNEICLVGSNPLDYLHCKLPTLSPLCYSANAHWRRVQLSSAYIHNCTSHPTPPRLCAACCCNPQCSTVSCSPAAVHCSVEVIQCLALLPGAGARVLEKKRQLLPRFRIPPVQKLDLVRAVHQMIPKRITNVAGNWLLWWSWSKMVFWFNLGSMSKTVRTVEPRTVGPRTVGLQTVGPPLLLSPLYIWY